MNTPIYDFVQNYCESNAVRLHMPGHKGVAGPLGVEPSDITEIEGADVLSRACGIIAESEANAGTLFGCRTLYSTEGSSLCVRAMVFLLKKIAIHKGREPRILAARNMHRSFLDAVAALDVAVDWIMPLAGDPYERCDITGEELAQIISDCRDDDRMPTAVFVTSPDYLGHALDIAELAEVCHSRGCYLAVDNAHGAYRKFLAVSEHPMDFGADLCCDSAHKTLPVLTGGAYLQVSRRAMEDLGPEIRPALSLFASTSPSYLILQSLDLCNAYLADGYPARLAGTIARSEALKAALKASGVPVLESEPLKLVIDASLVRRDSLPGAAGTAESGTAAEPDRSGGAYLAEILRGAGIEPEFADTDYLVLMLTPENPEEDYEKIKRALTDFCRAGRFRPGTPAPPLRLRPLPQALSVREAIFSPHEILPAADCIGRVCGQPTVSCPPAIPIAVSGEIITEDVIPVFLACGVTELSVVKQTAGQN